MKCAGFDTDTDGTRLVPMYYLAPYTRRLNEKLVEATYVSISSDYAVALAMNIGR